MKSGARLPSGWSIMRHMDPIEVTSIGPEPDPDWCYTDAAGHDHSAGGGQYPTLQWVEDETWWCVGCRDEHTDGHYECPLCGEHIVPGVRQAGPYRRYIEGMVTVIMTGPGEQRLVLSPEEVEDLMARGIEAANEIISLRGATQHGRA